MTYEGWYAIKPKQPTNQSMNNNKLETMGGGKYAN